MNEGIITQMNSLSKRFCLFLILTTSFLCIGNNVLASESLFPPIRGSQAYKEFKKRSYSELSKLIYLIDRFKNTDIKVLYDGAYYDASFAAKVCREFLVRFYDNDKATKWVTHYGTTSLFQNKPILFKFQGGITRLARRILLQELKDLDEAYTQDTQSGRKAAA